MGLSILGLICIIVGAILLLWPTIMAFTGNYEPFSIVLFVIGLIVCGLGVLLTIVF